MLEHSDALPARSQALQAGNFPSHFVLAVLHREQAATGLLTRNIGVSRVMRGNIETEERETRYTADDE